MQLSLDFVAALRQQRTQAAALVSVSLEGPAWLKAEAGLIHLIDGYCDPYGWLSQQSCQDSASSSSQVIGIAGEHVLLIET
jgi:hypothetical protein